MSESQDDVNKETSNEKISNRYGSLAGASAGDFHKYRKLRRLEEDRLQAMDDAANADKAEEAFATLLRKNAEAAKTKTQKNADRRKRKKANQKAASISKKQNVEQEESYPEPTSPNKESTSETDHVDASTSDSVRPPEFDNIEIVVNAQAQNRFQNDGSFLDAMKAVRELTKESVL